MLLDLLQELPLKLRGSCGRGRLFMKAGFVSSFLQSFIKLLQVFVEPRRRPWHVDSCGFVGEVLEKLLNYLDHDWAMDVQLTS